MGLSQAARRRPSFILQTILSQLLRQPAAEDGESAPQLKRPCDVDGHLVPSNHDVWSVGAVGIAAHDAMLVARERRNE